MSEKLTPKSKPSGKYKLVLTHSAFSAVLLFLVSFAVFIPSIKNDFVWDDISYIKNRIKTLQSSKIKFKSFIPSGGQKTKKPKTGRTVDKKDKSAKYFRPVHGLIIKIDAKLWGASPAGFHLTNIILHSVSTVLLYFLFLLVLKDFNVSGRKTIAFLSGMLFALYPLHVESVSFISARGDMLAAVFFFSTLIFYILSYRRFIYIIPAGICFYLSFLSKEIALSFPIVILGFDLISRKIKSRANLIKYLVLGALVLLYLYFRSNRYMGFTQMLSNKGIEGVNAVPGLGEFVTVFFSSYLFYLKKLVFPYDLNPFIGTIPGGDLLYTAISILAVSVLIIAAVLSYRIKEKVTAFSLLWIFATLGPAVMIAIFPLAITRFSDRFLYIPSAGYCLLAGYLIIYAGEKLRRARLANACGALLCLSFLISALMGQAVWRNELALWEYAVHKSPREIVPKMRYGYALNLEGRTEEAVTQYAAALSPETYGNTNVKSRAAQRLGILYLQKGDYARAEKSFGAAMAIDPGFGAQYNYYMGFMSLKKNDPDSAETYLVRSTELNPDNSRAYYLLGNIYLLKGDLENNRDYYVTAEEYLKKSASIKGSDAEAHLQLAKVYVKLGMIKKAKLQAQRAIKKGLQGNLLWEARAIIEMNQH